jgi:hypothetical protein
MTEWKTIKENDCKGFFNFWKKATDQSFKSLHNSHLLLSRSFQNNINRTSKSKFREELHCAMRRKKTSFKTGLQISL